MPSEAELQNLVDRAVISDLLVRIALAQDTRDTELRESCFLDEWEFSTTTKGMTSATIRKGERTPGDDMFAGFDSTQHLSTNHLFDIRGDEATVTSYFRADHFLVNDEGDNYITQGGFYTWDLVRTPLGWKVKKMAQTVTFNRGNRHVFRLATRKGRSL